MEDKPEEFITDIKSNKCEHYFIRKNATDIECSTCHSGWIDLGKFILEDGKILGKTA